MTNFSSANRLKIFLTILIILAIFLPAYQWRETGRVLFSQIELNESLKAEAAQLQQKLASEIEERKNLNKKLDKLQRELEKLESKIKELKVERENQKLKSPNLPRTIRLPILMYHHIKELPPGASGLWQDLTVSPEIFKKQMEHLFKHNYRPITFKDFFNYLRTRRNLPERALIITFDDGWRNQYENAFPVLKKYNFRATFFVVVDYIGGSKFMNREELKELINRGMEIGSHTMNHPNLRGFSESELKNEIQNSKIILERMLGQEIKVLAYPYGAFDCQVIRIVRESNYLAARSIIRGIDQDLENLYTLRTIKVLDNLDQFKRIFPATD